MDRKSDAIWSKAVKVLAGFRCEYCFKSKTLNSHHFFGRRYRATRYDTNNGFCLCPNCHINLAHQRPADFVVWAIKKRGEAWYLLLSQKCHKIKHDTSLDILYCRQVCKEENELPTTKT